jgi:iron complex transport system substrate-binding protein
VARALHKLALVAAVVALCFAGSAATARPMHIMSMNLCTDLLLLQMVPKARIASITYLAHDGVNGLFPGADAGVAINFGTSEDIVNEKPDLILTGENAIPETRKLAARALRTPLMQFKLADNFDDIRVTIRKMGAATGESARAETLIRRMDATLDRLARSRLPRRMRVVAWSGGSLVPGKGTLTDAIIEAAGAVNIAAQPGARNGTFDVEQLLWADPDALLYGGERAGEPSLHADEGQHRLVRNVFGDRRVDYNDVAHECGLPQSADSAWAIHRALMALSRKTAPIF